MGTCSARISIAETCTCGCDMVLLASIASHRPSRPPGVERPKARRRSPDATRPPRRLESTQA